MVVTKAPSDDGAKATSRPPVQTKTSNPYATLRRSKSQYDLAAAANIKALWITTLKPVLTMALFFNVMGILCLTFLVVAVSMRAQRHKAFYEFYPEPNVVEFEEVAVLTTTPQCNDLARVLAVENYTVFAIAAALQICLSYVEPQKSGLGGSSTVTFVDLDSEKPCNILDSFEFYHIPAFKKPSEDGIKVNKCLFERLEGMPFPGVAIPGEIYTSLALLKKIGEDERIRLKVFLENYKIDTNAISSLVAASNRKNSPFLMFSDQMSWMFESRRSSNYRENNYGEDLSCTYRPKDEGETYKYRVEMFDKIISNTSYKVNMEEVLALGCPGGDSWDLINIAFLVKDFFKTLEWERNNGTIFGNYTLCIPPPFGESLREAVPKDSQYRNEGDVTKKILIMNDFISDVFKYIREGKKSSNESKTHSRRKRNVGKQHLLHRGRLRKGMWQANMFVIVSKRERKAIVYVGTLGHFFGSNIKTKNNFFLNSIVYERLGPASEFGRLLPAILFKEGEISLALATPGGSTAHSLSLPRTIEMLLMKQHFNMSIVESVGHPLAYPSAELKSVVMKNRVPYVERLHRYYNVSKRSTDHLPDEILAVEKSGDKMIALHTDHLNDYSYMPAGI